MYDIMSPHAADFIDDGEIRASLQYAEENCRNRELIAGIIEKARLFKGLSHREALLLMDCDVPELNQQIFELAREIKKRFYGNRIVMFAPLYLSNYCINSCVYCPYHVQNRTIARKKLTQEEIRAEVIALQDMGHKRLALETGGIYVRSTAAESGIAPVEKRIRELAPKVSGSGTRSIPVERFPYLLATALLLLAGTRAERTLGKRGISIITKLTGLFLSALAAGMILEGIKNFFA